MSFFKGILLKGLWELLTTLIAKITWDVVLERFATRLVVWGLETLKNLSTNDVLQGTVDDILQSLQGKRLKALSSQPAPKE
ncbi:hypothetical protein ACB087_01260 [Vibrio sp. VNB-15]